MDGQIQIYTGNGKGKTTAALGISLRSLGAGKKVYFGQFMKDGNYSEIKALTENFKNITHKSFGVAGFIKQGKPREYDGQATDATLAKDGLETALEDLKTGDYDLFVLDELCVTQFMELLTLEECLTLIDAKPPHTELILTGRYAHQTLIEKADLVTEMKEIKHYFQKGVMARTGIEM